MRKSELRTAVKYANRARRNQFLSRPGGGDRESADDEPEGDDDRMFSLYVSGPDAEEAQIHRVAQATELIWKVGNGTPCPVQQRNRNGGGDKTKDEDDDR